MPFKDIERQREYSRQHYRQNKKRYFERNKINKQKLKKYVDGIKEKNPCVDCGKKYPYYVMDFDHLRDKKGIIMQFIRANNRANLENEISKCEIVCSNCHRERSHQRLKQKLHF